MDSGTSALHRVAGLIVTLTLAVYDTADAGTLSSITVPRPLSSADLARLERVAGTSDAERVAVEAAFDDYVEAWQRLRSQTLRPLRAALDDANEKSRAGPDQVPPEVFQQLRDQARQAYARLASLDDAFFATLRSGARTPEQLQAIDAEQRAIDARADAAAIQAVCTPGDTPWLLNPIAPLPDGLDAATQAGVARRLEQLDRETLPRLHRISVKALADTSDLPMGSDDARSLIALRLKTIDEIGAVLPPAEGLEWVDRVRTGLFMASFSGSVGPPRSVMMTTLGDGMDPATRARLDRWFAERRPLEDEVLLGTDFETRRAIEQRLDALDDEALNDLAKATGMKDLRQQVTSAWRAWVRDRISRDPRTYDDDDGIEVTMTRRAAARTDATADAEDAPSIMRGLGMTRGIRQSQVDRIRDALGVTAGQRTLWDALADDLLEQSARLNRERGLQASLMAEGPARAIEGLDRMRDHRVAQQELEEHWFDAVAAALPDIPKQRLVEQRDRRALQRLRESADMVRSAAIQTGDRWMDIDLDAVLAQLSDESRARVAEAAAECRARCVRDLRQAIDEVEARLRELLGVLANMAADAQPSPEAQARMERITDGLRRHAAELSRRSRTAMQQDLEWMASRLSVEAGEPLRRAMRREQYPEVFRPLERVDRDIERMMSLPDLTATQIDDISTEADAYRIRSEALADRQIVLEDTLHTADRALEAIRRQDPSDAYAQADARMTRNRAFLNCADAEFDQNELAARTLRHLRARLEASQPKATKAPPAP